MPLDSGEIRMSKKKLLNLVSLLGLALAVALFMPQRAAADDDDDPPSRVARLAYTNGSVSFNPAGTDDWVSAVVNRPVTTGDKLWNDNGSRSELNIGSAVIRLGSNTGFSFLNLTDNITQLRITEGTLNIRVRNLDNDEVFEVDTPNLAFSILRAGNYKINVNEAGDTTVVVVRDGQGEVTGGGSAYTIHPREVGTFIGDDQLDADVQSWGRDGDDFDNWCADRDRRIDRSVSARYVSNDAIGYEDLDDYGGWRSDSEYGNVWFPHTTVVGWAPYRYGHWIWVSPWGWTWVDDAPWGFAPFHYGRWVTVRGVWGWVPCAPRAVVGVAYVRPVYAPALVAWVGGPHFGVGIAVGGGGGGVAWFPLGPREVYVPSYRVSRRYVNNVNISNTTVNTTVVNNYYNTTVINKNVTNVKYVNQGVRGGVTATSSESFASSQSVGRHAMKFDEREAARAQVAVNSPGVVPVRQAVLGGGAATARPPANLQNRAVVAKIAPPPRAVPFERQQEAIKANGGRPLDRSEERQLQPQATQARPNIRMAPAAQPGTFRGRQANNPGNMQNNSGNRPGAQNNNSGQPPVNPGNNPGNTQNNSGNRPGSQNNNPVQLPPNPGNKPVGPDSPGQPPVNPGNRPGAPNNQPPDRGNPRSRNDRPPSSRPDNSGNNVDPRLVQKHEQQQEQLRQKQDQERQRIDQQQQKQQQKLEQQRANDQRQQQAQQKQQQQLEQVERKHSQEQQALQQKQQQQERQQQQKQERQKDKPSSKPPKDKDAKPPRNG
jgi:hypothetical protein